MREKSKFGTRPRKDIHMFNEIIFRELKHFRNHKVYRPNFGASPVTGKFYACHDQTPSEEDKEIEHYHYRVSQIRSVGPRNKYSGPATEAQVYGWYHEPGVPMEEGRANHHRKDSIYTKIENHIFMTKPIRR
ncbi:uncharacterized protein LOC113230930 [Hyposmocoma kahamanoa]|uniref:uncharacterized protein LOC113230930 n=1 Tax=Hyposmocoma kahamanoa TaxID=1477025 RepID=UPI000E6D8B81|nr:uncharacterized protein LOC113230930 [Hyposmocoma kahamanoa]